MTKFVNFFEVMSNKGDVVWGGASAITAIEWFRKSFDNSLFVSVWNEADPDNPVLVSDKIDITNLLLATVVSERDRV